MPHLLIIDPRRERSRFDLERSSTRVGRLPDNDLVLDDRTVTRREHFRIDRHEDDRYYLRHTKGKNPTILNDTAVKAPTQLQHGDRIEIGQWTLVFFERDAPTVLADLELPDSEMTVVSGEDAGLTPPPDGPESDAGGSTLEVVIEADLQLTLESSLDDMFHVLLDLAQRVVNFERGMLLLLKNGSPGRRYVRLPDGQETDSLVVSGKVVEHVAREGEAILVGDTRVDDCGELDSVVGHRVRSLMCVPLPRDDKVVGLLYLDSRRKSTTFNAKNLKVVMHLAAVAAIKIENRRLVEQQAEAMNLREELRRAADIQRYLLPREEPRVDGYLITGRTLPCFGVGGDWYDWMPAPGDGLGLCLGDIAGKGLSAAMLMSSAHASLRALSQMRMSPDELLERLNALLGGRFPYNRFVTIWYSVLDPVAHTLTFVNACQERPLFCSAHGESRLLDSCGPPVGLFPGRTYSAHKLELEPGDFVLVYSDGIVDCQNEAEELFGVDRLRDLVTGMVREEPSEIIEAILDAVDSHRGARHHEDDVTLLLLKRLG